MKEFNPFESGYPMLILNKPPVFMKKNKFFQYPIIPEILSELMDKSDPYYIPVRNSGNLLGFFKLYYDSIICRSTEMEKIRDEYRKFIEENKYRRIKRITDFRPLSVQWLQCTKSNGNNIKYDSRRLLNDMGK